MPLTPQNEPSTTWAVMFFGDSQRPSISVSADLRLALASFYELAHMFVALVPDGPLSLAADDDDAALRGLSLYYGESLILCLQPAMGIVGEGARVDASLVSESFSALAPLILAALGERKHLTTQYGAKFLHSTVAMALSRDVDALIRGEALSEGDPSVLGHPDGQAAWKAIAQAHAMVSTVATIR